jgi:hypothetical protein
MKRISQKATFIGGAFGPATVVGICTFIQAKLAFCTVAQVAAEVSELQSKSTSYAHA